MKNVFETIGFIFCMAVILAGIFFGVYALTYSVETDRYGEIVVMKQQYPELVEDIKKAKENGWISVGEAFELDTKIKNISKNRLKDSL